MNNTGGVGAQASALPGDSPAFREHEIVLDISKDYDAMQRATARNQRVRIVSVIRHEQIHTTCIAFHRGAHTKNCQRRTEVWFQYCVTTEIHKGKHDNSRPYKHLHERNLQFLEGVTT